MLVVARNKALKTILSYIVVIGFLLLSIWLIYTYAPWLMEHPFSLFTKWVFD